MMVSSELTPGAGRLCQLAVMAVGGLLAHAALAVTISPVKVELSPAHPVVAITVVNDADVSLTLQNQVLAWTQVNGEDHLEESTELLVAPAIAEIEAGGTQVFRVTLRHPTASVSERAYRLVLDDVSAIERHAQTGAVNFVFSHRLPVFVAGTGTLGPKPRLGTCPNSSEQGCFRLRNDGDHYVQVLSLVVGGTNWQQDLGAGNRILPGAWRQWTVASPPASAGRLTVTVETLDGRMSLELPNPGL